MIAAIATMIRHIRYAIRTLWRARAFSLPAILTMAVAIGMTTATFSVVHAVLLKPLPVRDQRTLALLTLADRAHPEQPLGVPNGVLWALQERHQSLSGVAGVPVIPPVPFAMRHGDRGISLAVAPVTGNLFDVLGVSALHGRLLHQADDRGTEGVAGVLSYSAWKRQFGGSTAVIGQTISANFGEIVLVGVAPPGFEFPAGTDLWLSSSEMMGLEHVAVSGESGLWQIVARLSSSDQLHLARREYQSYIESYQSSALPDPSHRWIEAESYVDAVVGHQRVSLALLFGGVLLVLIIACVNVAGLQLVRATARQGELAVRTALGATRRQLLVQLLTESTVLGLVGGMGGVALAGPLVRVGLAVAPPNIPRLSDVHIDVPSLAFGLLVSTCAVAMSGVAPALVQANADVEVALRAGGRGQTGASERTWRLRRAVVVAQIALAVVVLVSSGLLARSLAALNHLQLGFEPDGLLFAVVEQVDGGALGDPGAASARHTAVMMQLANRLSSEPGILGATPTNALPFSVVGGTQAITTHYSTEGQGIDASLRSPDVGFYAAADNYFSVLRIPIIEGRAFNEHDDASAPRVGIVSRSFAQRAWPGQEALGHSYRAVANSGYSGAWRTVVGVVADTRYRDLMAAEPAVYIPVRQTEPGTFLAVRTRGDPAGVVPLLRRDLQGLDQGYGIAKTVTGSDLLAYPMARTRFLASVLALLSAITLVLVGLGVFSVLAGMVGQRSHELAIRLALGATTSDVRRLVLRQAAGLTAVGAFVGFGVALAATQALRALLFGVEPADTVSFLGALACLLILAGVAAYVPARRAAQQDPLAAFRQ